MIEYVSLHNHTHFSIMQALVSPDDLFERCAEVGQKAVAVTDLGTLSGLWDSYKASKKHGVKLIAGCEFYFVNDVENKEEQLRHIVLIAKNAVGYKNLLLLNKVGYDNFIVAFKKAIPRIDWKLLEKYSDGLICTTACGNGIISQLLMKKNFVAAKEQLIKLKEIFKDNIAVELQPHAMVRKANAYSGEIDQRFINIQLSKLAQELNIRCIVATDVHYFKKEHNKAHDVLLAIGSGQPIGSGNRLKYNVPDFYVKNSIEVAQYFLRLKGIWEPDFIASLFENTIYFADQCEDPAWIDPKFTNPTGKELPEFPVKNQPDYDEFLVWRKENEFEDKPEDVGYLRYWCELNFKDKVPPGKEQQYRDRLNEEFDVIEYHGFSSYMLIVADFINWAKNNGIRTSPGRGCLSGDTMVLTDNGFKQLKYINVGESVFTHTGNPQKVINKFEFDVSKENLIEIKTKNSFGTLVLTKDHEVYAINKETNNIFWMRADEFNKSHGLISVFPKRKIEDINKIDLANFVYDNDKNILINCEFIEKTKLNTRKINSIRKVSKETGLTFECVRRCRLGKSKSEVLNNYLYENNIDLNLWKTNKIQTIKRYIDINSDFVYLLGRWVGDGCFKNNSGIIISFNSEDIAGINKVKKIFDNLGLIYYAGKSKRSKAVNIEVVDKIIYRLFKEIFPDYKRTSATKHFPNFFRKLNNDLLQSLMFGYFDADGSTLNGAQFAKTISKRLAYERKEALLYLGKASSVYTTKAGTYSNRNCKESYSLYAKHTKHTKHTHNGYYSDFVTKKDVKQDKVYDITVENDHSYLTTNGVVHNSVGGSLIAYLLGIHAADPIKYKLVFARFHNKQKKSYPDIDCDIPASKRHLVQDYIRRKYGEDYVAHVSNVNTITPKVFIKDISRTFEFGGDRTEAAKIGQQLSDLITDDVKSIQQAIELVPLFSEYTKQFPELLEYSDVISNKIRAWSTHAGGLVISKRPLTGLVPVRRDKDGSFALEYEKERTEENGLVKMDTLGLKELDDIDCIYDLIKKSGKTPPPDPIDFEQYDEKTYDLISSGNTFGVFQLGATAVPVCRNLKPKNIMDISNITALVRPSAESFRDDFIRIHNKEKEINLLHPALENSFKDTYGFGLYEECLIYLAHDIAGWDLHEADSLRKITKDKGKNPKKTKETKEKFISDAQTRKGFDKDDAAKIWENVVEEFAGYGFNMSHALVYSILTYQTAYLKAHFPLEFLVANLMSEVNSNAKKAVDNIVRIKNEIRQLGVNIIAPDINTSEMSYKIVDDKTLMTGLNSLKYMGNDAIPEIIAKRPFSSFEDFLMRVDGKKVRSTSIQALAASGSLDCFGISRKLMFLYASDFRKKYQVYAKKDPIKRGEFKYPWPDVSEWTVREKFAMEEFYLGEGLSGSIQERYEGFFKNSPSFTDFEARYDYNDLKPDEPIRNKAKKEAFDKRKRKLNTYNLVESGELLPRGVITNVFSFKVKKEDSSIRGQIMAKLMLQDAYGNEFPAVAFPSDWQHIQDIIAEVSGGKCKIQSGLAIKFKGFFYRESPNSSQFILSDISGYKPAPEKPADIKSKKVVMKRSSVKKELSKLDKKKLAEELEDELIEEGVSTIEEDDEGEI